MKPCETSWPREGRTPAETPRRCASCPATVSAVERPPSGNVGSPEGFTSTRFGGSWKCQLTGGFHDEFAVGGWRAGHGRAMGKFWWTATQRGARLSSPKRESKREEEMDASTSPGASPWRSCMRLELTSGARGDVRAPNVAGVLTPVGHVDELGSHSDMAIIV